MPQIIPAILTDNIETFEKQLRQVEKFTEIIHLDICDNIFVPQKTISAEDIKNIKTTIQYAIHLMVQDPTSEIERWYDLPNIKRIIFHFETAKIPAAVIHHIEAYGFKAGVAVNPETTLEDIKAVGYQADLTLFLSVNPGQQGQKIIPEVIEKIKIFKVDHPNSPIAIDGGIHEEELKQLTDLKLDHIVMGSEIFSHSSPGEHLRELQKLVG